MRTERRHAWSHLRAIDEFTCMPAVEGGGGVAFHVMSFYRHLQTLLQMRRLWKAGAAWLGSHLRTCRLWKAAVYLVNACLKGAERTASQ